MSIKALEPFGYTLSITKIKEEERCENNVITIQDIPITVAINNKEDDICISDITKAKSGNTVSQDIIKNRIRNRYTLKFLGTWEKYIIRF